MTFLLWNQEVSLMLVLEQSWDSLSGLRVDGMRICTLAVFWLCASPCEGKQKTGLGISFWREGKEEEPVWVELWTRVWEDHQICTFQRPRLLVRVGWPCFVSPGQISNLCAEEAAAQEQTGQVEECLKVNLLKIKTDMCKRVTAIITSPFFL